MNLLNNQTISKILFIRLSSMGDILLTTGLVRNVRNSFPNAKIDFITSGEYSEIYRNNPHINDLYEYSKSFDINQLKQFKQKILSNSGEYDIVIDLHRNMRTKLLRAGLGKLYLKTAKRRLFKLILVHFKINIQKKIRAIPDIYRDTVSLLNVDDDAQGLEFWLPEDKASAVYSPGTGEVSGNIRKIAIAPGAFHFTKRMPPEKFIEVADMINAKYGAEIILLGGSSDKEICDRISAGTKAETKNHSGAKSLAETARLLDQCDALITNDTGVMHIAAARQIPIIAIFGSTVADFGFAPYRVPNLIIEKEIKCRPCTHIGRSDCPKQHFNCMNEINSEEIIFGIDKLLKNKSEYQK